MRHELPDVATNEAIAHAADALGISVDGQWLHEVEI